MPKISKEEILFNIQNSILSTREERYKQVDFTIHKEENRCILQSGPAQLELSINDEIILYILFIYGYMPLFLAKQFLKTGSFIGQEKSKLIQYRDFGLIYEYPTPVGIFLMPTDKLAILFGKNLGDFVSPNYNLLTHSVSEEKIMYECMTGTAEYLKDIPHIPYISQLGLGKNSDGTSIISEEQYSVSRGFFYKNLEKYNEDESKLREEIKAGKQITTPDLKEQNLIIYKKKSADKYDYKLPDLAILAPRKIINGIAFPQSTAIEVELTGKGMNKYKDLLQLYYNNMKFGKVIYLTPDGKIRDDLLKAWNKIDKSKTQTCELEILDFVIPYNKDDLL